MEKELNIFQDLVCEALSLVDQSYYTTTYENILHLKNFIQYKTGIFDGVNYEKYGERVFCYEFYHQLRKLIDDQREKAPDFLQGCLLQGEVKKWQVEEIISKFELERLSGEFIPDFLMHTSGSSDSHPFVIEVKAKKGLANGEIFHDIDKLYEFITRYHYHRGIFISVNEPREGLMEIIEQLRQDHTHFKNGLITIICKEDQDTEPLIEVF